MWKYFRSKNIFYILSSHILFTSSWHLHTCILASIFSDPSKPDRDAEPGEGERAWPAFTIPELQSKELSLEMGVVRAVRAAQCHFWNEYLPELAQFAGERSIVVREVLLHYWAFCLQCQPLQLHIIYRLFNNYGKSTNVAFCEICFSLKFWVKKKFAYLKFRIQSLILQMLL